MASRIIFSNRSRTDDYTILLNSEARGVIAPLRTETFDLEPGEYGLLIQGSNDEGLPSVCKPIQIMIEDGKTVHLNIEAKHFVIGIYDEQGTQLNAKCGFLCGSVAEGVYVDNPIS